MFESYVERLWNKRQQKNLLEDLKKNFSSFTEEQKTTLLKKSLGGKVDKVFAEFISEEMGCSIKTKEGVREILPLVSLGSPKKLDLAAKIFELENPDKEIETRFGKVHPLIALSKSMVGSKWKGALDLDDGRITVIDKLIEDLDVIFTKSEFFNKTKLEWVRFLVQEEGSLLKKERQEIKPFRPEGLNFSDGIFNELAKSILPAEPTRVTREALELNCEKFPKLMRSLALAIYFDEPGIPNPDLFDKVWGMPLNTDGTNPCWITHLDVLFEKKILEPREAFLVLGQMLELKSLESFDRYRRDSCEYLVNMRIVLPALEETWKLLMSEKDLSFIDPKRLDFSNFKKFLASLGKVESEINKALNWLEKVEIEGEKEVLKRLDNSPVTKKDVFKI